MKYRVTVLMLVLNISGCRARTSDQLSTLNADTATLKEIPVEIVWDSYAQQIMTKFFNIYLSKNCFTLLETNVKGEKRFFFAVYPQPCHEVREKNFEQAGGWKFPANDPYITSPSGQLKNSFIMGRYELAKRGTGEILLTIDDFCTGKWAAFCSFSVVDGVIQEITSKPAKKHPMISYDKNNWLKPTEDMQKLPIDYSFRNCFKLLSAYDETNGFNQHYLAMFPTQCGEVFAKFFDTKGWLLSACKKTVIDGIVTKEEFTILKPNKQCPRDGEALDQSIVVGTIKNPKLGTFEFQVCSGESYRSKCSIETNQGQLTEIKYND